MAIHRVILVLMVFNASIFIAVERFSHLSRLPKGSLLRQKCSACPNSYWFWRGPVEKACQRLEQRLAHRASASGIIADDMAESPWSRERKQHINEIISEDFCSTTSDKYSRERCLLYYRLQEYFLYDRLYSMIRQEAMLRDEKSESTRKYREQNMDETRMEMERMAKYGVLKYYSHDENEEQLVNDIPKTGDSNNESVPQGE